MECNPGVISTEELFKSEIASFFTPATEPTFFSPSDSGYSVHSTNLSRRDIHEESKPQTKTLTLEDGTSRIYGLSSGKETAVNGTTDGDMNEQAGKRALQRLDSSVNPQLAAHLDEVAAKLGFHVSNRKVVPNSCSDTSGSAVITEPSQCSYVNQNGRSAPNAAPPPSGAPSSCTAQGRSRKTRAPSFFTSIMRRLSSVRTTRQTSNHRQTSVKQEPLQNSPGDTPSKVRPPIKFKRWLSSRIGRRVPQQTYAAQNSNDIVNGDSQPSLASAGAVLESVAEKPNHVTKSDTEFGSVPVQRKQYPWYYGDEPKRIMHEDQASQYSCEDLTCHVHPNPTSATNGTHHLLAKFGRRVGRGKTRLTCSHVNNTGDRNPRSPVIRTQSTRTNGDRTAPDQQPLAVPRRLKRETSGSESDALYKPTVALNEGGLAASTRPIGGSSKLPQSITYSPLLTPELPVPSYLNVSVAAFGYTGYGRKGSSSRSLASPTTPISAPPKMLAESVCLAKPKLHGALAAAAAVVVEVEPSTNVTASKGNNKDSDIPPPLSLPADDATLRQSRPTQLRFEKLPSPTALSAELPSSRLRSPSDVQSPECGVRMRRTRTRSHTSGSEDQEHWQRSSLIMLAVAHASPRGRAATTISSIHAADVDEPKSGAVQSTPNTPSPNIVFPSLPIVKVVTESTAICPTTTPIPETDGERDDLANHTNGVPVRSVQNVTAARSHLASDATANVSKEDVKDGHFYLAEADRIEAELLAQINVAESDLCVNEQLADDVSGQLRTAVGKARLLLTEKFQQFRSLCHQNLAWHSSLSSVNGCEGVDHTDSIKGFEFVTRTTDLDGFWALVMLQVTDVETMFTLVQQLRDNGWQTPVNQVTTTPARTPLTPRPTANRSAAKSSGKRDDAITRAKARERLRQAKRDMLAKQAVMTAVIGDTEATNNGVMFV